MKRQNKNDDSEALIVIGASGHAKVVIDVIEKQGGAGIFGLFDDNPALKGRQVFGYRVMGGKQEIETQPKRPCLVAIGDNRTRHDVAVWLESAGFRLCAAVVHPGATLARGAAVGNGTTLVAGSVINSDTTIGNNCIVNTGANVDHDCHIGDSVHIAPGATLCGGVTIGDLSFIGAGAVVCPNVSIGRNVVVGAGATVLKDVADDLSVVGSPAAVVD